MMLTKQCSICDSSLSSRVEFYPEERVLCGSCLDTYMLIVNGARPFTPSNSRQGKVITYDVKFFQQTADKILSAINITDVCAICDATCFKHGNLKYNCCARCSIIINSSLNIKGKVNKCSKDGCGFAATKYEALIASLREEFKNSKITGPCNCVPWWCDCKGKWDSVEFIY